MEVIYLITAKQKNKLETLPMPFSIMSRNIACKAANGPLCMQLLKIKIKKKKKERINNQDMGNGGGG